VLLQLLERCRYSFWWGALGHAVLWLLLVVVLLLLLLLVVLLLLLVVLLLLLLVVVVGQALAVAGALLSIYSHCYILMVLGLEVLQLL
jgi:hypothetical protein